MLKAKGAAACILSLVLLTVPIGSKVSASTLLQKGMSGEQVVQLQRDLKKLGYFQEECTGYYLLTTGIWIFTLPKDGKSE
jgi:peptidoglycan hydrolase-like protein with peptidoglycan-binding domain